MLGHAHTDLAWCTRGRTPSTAVLMLFALFVSDELVTLVTLTVATGKGVRLCADRHDRVEMAMPE